MVRDVKGSEIVEDQAACSRHKRLPIDRGWAWVILLATSVIQFILMGQVKCFGIIFVQLQKRFNSSSSSTALIFTIQNAFYSIIALLVMTIGQSMTCRQSVLIGAALCSLSSITTAFTENISVAYVTLGVTIGISHSFIMPQLPTILSLYFEKHRSFANNASNSGVCLGGLALAPLLTFLFEFYSFTGTFFIITGLHLNIFVAGALLRPLEFYEARFSEPGLLQENSVKQLNEMSEFEIDEANCLPKVVFRSHNEETIVVAVDVVPENQEMDGEKSQLYKDQELELKKDITPTNMNKEAVGTPGNKQNIFKAKHIKTACQIFLSRLFDKKLLSKPVFHYLLVCNFFLCAGSATASAYLPPHALEIGANETRVAWMVSIISIADLISRFVFGLLADSKLCKRSTLVAICCGILGVSAHFVRFMTSFMTIMIYAVLAGFLQGLYFSLFMVLILDVLTFSEFKGAMGFTSLVQGVSAGLCYPTAGYLRDVSGSYLISFNFIGTLLVVGAILTYFLPHVDKLFNKKTEHK